jgi:hypothetical protein
VTAPAGVTRRIRPGLPVVTIQTFPSGPAVSPAGVSLTGKLGVTNSFAPAVKRTTRPGLLLSVNHITSPGPCVIVCGAEALKPPPMPPV